MQVQDFITPQEEEMLIRTIGFDAVPSTHRIIKRYGKLIPTYNSFLESEQIPDYLQKLCHRLVEWGLATSPPAHVTVNQYQPGQNIMLHKDAPDGGNVVTVLSLNAETVMIFKNETEEKRFVLHPRSLIQMSGDLRWNWMHATEPTDTLRYSVVFRHI